MPLEALFFCWRSVKFDERIRHGFQDDEHGSVSGAGFEWTSKSWPGENVMASELTPVPDDLDFGQTIRGLVVSQQVFGRYKLQHVLGRGGMGVVWLAHDERLDRDVALKFLPEAVNFDAVAIDDLKRETRRCLELTHPNIIRIYDFVKEDQAAAISMEYVDGKTLAALRVEKENRVFEVDEIRGWIANACQALLYAHEEVKVVHRDLKPANLMLTSRGQVKIADFGIARSVSDSMSQVTMRKGTSGTLVYMSPQQMNGDMARVSDDIYALGATIYELLTSKPPFYSGDIPFQVRESTPRPMAERRREMEIGGEEIPREWEDTIAACLAKVPGHRPADMQEMAERLGLPSGTRSTRSETREKKTEAVSLETKKVPALPKAPKPPRKPFPGKLVLAGLLGLIALGAGGWALWSFVLWPFIATPGELLVTSTPVGATVHVSGQQDRVTPADFSHLRIGHYHVTIAESGFEPVDETLTITEGATNNLGTIVLKRAFGKLSLTTLPTRVHYSLEAKDPAVDAGKSGTTPDFFSNLPAGDYQLTLSEEGLESQTLNLTVPPHQLLAEKSDLIQQSLAADASPDPGKVLLGQLDAGQLDAKGKAEWLDLIHRAFSKYLSYGLLLPASQQLATLKAQGQETAALDQELASRRKKVEDDLGSQIADKISDKRIATAEAQLKSLDGVLEKESIDRLNARFQQPITQYQQQVEGAIKISQTGPPAAAYEQLKAFAGKYPDDLSLQLALAQLETEMPPDHDRLTAQLRVFREFASENKVDVTDPDFQNMQDKFANELKQLDDLAEALAEAKGGPASVRSEIARLEEEKAAAEKRRVGENTAAGLADTANFFGRIVTGHAVVDSSAFYTSQEQKDEQIASIQARIDSEQQQASAPEASIEDAQRRYDEFVARVPW
jgi:serine/threonine protein kinase